MNDLSHFVPLTETVTVRNQKIKLVGVDLEDLGQLLYRFKEISNMVVGGKFDPKALSREAMSAFVAMGAGKAGDDTAEKSIASLSLGERLSLFNAVFRLTSPGGIGPFVEMVTTLTGGVVPDEAAPQNQKKAGARIRLKG
jgi:hypothetical protein